MPFGAPENPALKQWVRAVHSCANRFSEATQMVKRQEQNSGRRPANQGVRDVIPEPNRINASTLYDFNGRNLTPYGGLLPVVTMLERLDFQSLVEQTLTSQRIPRAMDLYRFVLGIVLGLYIGFPRLSQLRFIARDPILTGILNVIKLPVQSTFWRFINALHRNIARQVLTIMRTMRERVWEAANVKLEVVTIDTDTTVHTLYATASCINEAEKIYQQIRHARAAMKISRGFDLELDAANPMTPEFLRSVLEFVRERGHLPQLVCPGPVAEKDLDAMAATAQHFQITLSFRYRGEPAETVRAIAKAMAGRLNYRVRNAAEAEFVAEHLL